MNEAGMGRYDSMACNNPAIPAERKEQTMSRYIDADALHDALKTKQKWVVRCGDKHNEGYTYDQVHFAIDEAPSIDLIRCVECRKVREDGGHANCGGYLYCRKWKTLVDEDGYCSWGEREGE